MRSALPAVVLLVALPLVGLCGGSALARPDEPLPVGWSRAVDPSGSWALDLPAGFVATAVHEGLHARDAHEVSIFFQVSLSQIPLSQIPLSQIPLSQVPSSQVPSATANDLDAQARAAQNHLIQGLEGGKVLGQQQARLGTLEAIRLDLSGNSDGTAGRLRAYIALVGEQELLLALWAPQARAESYFAALDQVARSVRSAPQARVPDAEPEAEPDAWQSLSGGAWALALPPGMVASWQDAAGLSATNGVLQLQLLVAARTADSTEQLAQDFIGQAAQVSSDVTVRRRAATRLASYAAVVLELEQVVGDPPQASRAHAWLTAATHVEVVLVGEYPADQRESTLPVLERIVASLTLRDAAPAASLPGAQPADPTQPAVPDAPVPAPPLAPPLVLETRTGPNGHFLVPVPGLWSLRSEGTDLVAMSPGGEAGLRVHSDSGSQRSPEEIRHQLLRDLALQFAGVEVLREARTPVPGAFEAHVIEVRHKIGDQTWIRTLVVTLTRARRHWLWLSAQEGARADLESTFARILEGYRPRD